MTTKDFIKQVGDEFEKKYGFIIKYPQKTNFEVEMELIMRVELKSFLNHKLQEMAEVAREELLKKLYEADVIKIENRKWSIDTSKNTTTFGH
jgi:hypothetical protein